MAEIAYLVRPAGTSSTFVDDAADTFAARPGVTVVDTATTLEGVFADLRARVTAGETFHTINLVCPDSGSVALPFPLSEARRGVDGGRVTAATLHNALRSAGAPGYPAVLGAPAVTEDTAVWIHGPYVGSDLVFVTRLGELFGPSLTVYAPLVPEVVGGDLDRYRRTVLSGERAPSTHALDVVAEPTPVEEPMSQLFGKYRGEVVNDQDPLDQGRLQVRVAAASPDAELWAVACLPPVPAGLVRRPEIGSTVWVEFEGGDSDLPIWTGVTWGTQFDPTAGVVIESDTDLTLRAGQNVVVTAGTAIGATAGTAVRLTGAAAASLESGGRAEIKAGAGLDVDAPTVGVSAGMTQVDGALKTGTLITTSVVSASYTPGAGNVM